MMNLNCYKSDSAKLIVQIMLWESLRSVLVGREVRLGLWDLEDLRNRWKDRRREEVVLVLYCLERSAELKLTHTEHVGVYDFIRLYIYYYISNIYFPWSRKVQLTCVNMSHCLSKPESIKLVMSLSIKPRDRQ